jgi:hypothetical protein
MALPLLCRFVYVGYNCITLVSRIEDSAYQRTQRRASENLAASFAQLGRNTEARAAAVEFRASMDPKLSSLLGNDRNKWRDHWAKMFSIFTHEDFEHLLAGLRKAGLPA